MLKASGDPQLTERALRELAAAMGFTIVPITREASRTPRPDAVPDVFTERVTTAECWLRARDIRSEVLPGCLLGEPGWDMLLDLFIQTVRGREMSVSSLGIASRAPMSTALRWIALLEREGIIVRRDDPFDRRRHLVELTDQGMRNVEDLLDRVLASNRRRGIMMHSVPR